MKKLLFTAAIFLLFQINVSAQTIIELDGVQSMSIAGKGEGQNAAINPYSDVTSVATVENLGKKNFKIRIEKKGRVVKEIIVKPKKVQRVTLLKNYVMYFDSKAQTTAKVSFEKAPSY